MNDILCEDNKIKYKNVVSIYTIRMYINGFIIGYVFRQEIHRKFYIYKKDNIIFSLIKKNIYIKNNTKKLQNSFNLAKHSLYNTRLNNKLNFNNKNINFFFKLPLFNILLNFKNNIQISNFLAFRLSFWTCVCTFCCCKLNKSMDNSIIPPIISGIFASSVSKLIFRENKKILIPTWLGCVLSYVIYI
ncbi:conserved Plasmodium protein, unknown function [Plasmodium gallinaceum]|uniref:Uncharacterized protein n=1 Tax=Plasmodium gallinaceum TaxID=5849 RepID=A0A1J1GQC6_PLAGA|nr:conserved Plasmodium protein, unknown function [Plasmodium gallinaceum]CRG94643.1 conserved Plasmodium protein, unknown function [Plasmodium gallinaceum]